MNSISISMTNKGGNGDEFDLNIDNYDLEDLYRLFKIDKLDEVTLKQARRVALSMHPDKSGKDPKYYRFFYKAYSILLYMMEHKKGTSVGVNYSVELEKQKNENDNVLKIFLENNNDNLNDIKRSFL